VDLTIHHIHLQGFEEDHIGKLLHVAEFLQDTRHTSIAVHDVLQHNLINTTYYQSNSISEIQHNPPRTFYILFTIKTRINTIILINTG
jgi:hypothetical protein